MAQASAPAAGSLESALRELRRHRGDASWAAVLARLARDLLPADRAALLQPAHVTASPEEWTPTPAWCDAARSAEAAPVADPDRPDAVLLAVALAAPGRPPALFAAALFVRSPLQLALARERLVLLAALATAELEAADALRLGLPALCGQAGSLLLEAADPAEGLHAAAARLAGGLGVARVSLGLGRAHRIVAFGDSGGRDIAAGSQLARELTAALNDGLDVEQPLAAVAGEGTRPGVAALLASRHASAVGLANVPARDGAAAAVLLDAPGLADPAGIAGAIAASLGPALRHRAAAFGRDRHRLARRRARRVGLPVVVAVAVVLGGMALIPWPDEVEAPFVLEADARRTVTAPFDGVLAASTVEPGTAVAAGAALARISTREIELELAAARAKANSDRMEAEVQRARGAPASEQVAALSAERAEAQAALLQERIRQAEIVSPVDGIVLSGDLRRQVGQAVQRGQVLFEVSPSDNRLEADVLVPDRLIPEVAPGQSGRLAPAAYPGRIITATVTRISPMAEVVQGRNIFRVRVRLDLTDLSALRARPGMQGVARIDTGWTNLLALLVREPVRIARAWLWL